MSRDFVVGGDRPVTVHVPPSYDASVPAPLVILLHGYGANGVLQNIYFGLQPVAMGMGFIYAYPDGTMNVQGLNFWNATDACCDFFGSGVDDVAYLTSVVDAIQAQLNVDPRKVYFVGHSNGGFMAYRMACELSGRVAGVVSLAGGTFADDSRCGASSPVNVLQIHGTADGTIAYGGGANGAVEYPGAEASLRTWAARARCGPLTETGQSFELDTATAGAETAVLGHTGCAGDFSFELWRGDGVPHIPTLAPDFPDRVLAHLLAHPRP